MVNMANCTNVNMGLLPLKFTPCSSDSKTATPTAVDTGGSRIRVKEKCRRGWNER